ncbi:hypothetical protein [Roseomonas sp. BN140053]|uniref:hypothetical protein n=1 Tax=Roseomonas sp. BN140053 TaxID=3391898 RepID=UPI0039ED06A7
MTTDTTTAPAVTTAAGLAELLGVTPATVARLTARGALPATAGQLDAEAAVRAYVGHLRSCAAGA